MDKTFLKIARLYDEMYLELAEEIQVLGGKIEEFSPEELCIYVTVDPSLQSYTEDLIKRLVLKYDKRRRRIVNADAFIGVKSILLENDNLI